MFYRKKPVVIEAVQWTGDNTDEIIQFCNSGKDAKLVNNDYIDDGLLIFTLEGDMFARVGDYIIKGVNGEYYPCKPDIFKKTYDKVENVEDESDENEIEMEW